MSSVKCIGAMAALGGAIASGATYYSGSKIRKRTIEHAQVLANANGGKIRTGGMTKDGALWDGFTTVDEIKKKSKKDLNIASAISAATGAVVTGVISGLTLLAKAKIFK